MLRSRRRKLRCCNVRLEPLLDYGRVVSIERELLDARRAGRQAARQAGANRNPHRGAAATSRERVLSVMWRRGYRAGNPLPDPLSELVD